jgi:hypothetical protein
MTNPDIIIDKFLVKKNVKVNVIRDDYLEGGTKQRALDVLMKKKYNEYIYAGPAEGYAQIALAYIGGLYNKKVTIFLAKRKKDTDLTTKAREYGAKIKYISPPNRINNLRQKSIVYEKKNKNRKLLPFGLDSELYITSLAQRIKEAWGRKRKPKRIWLVSGSATILRALALIFPDACFLVVEVGKKIWPDLVEGINHKIYKSSLKFYQNATVVPPYNSVITYDAKLWEFVVKHGINGDYVWNVAGDVKNEY